MRISDGGSAFPGDNSQVRHNPGMTLRDYFAAKALQGMLASDAHPQVVLETLMDGPESRLERAKFAYSIADAMLEAREA